MLALKIDMDQVGASDAATHGNWPGRWPRRAYAVRARLENLDNFTRPKTILTLCSQVEADAHALARQREAHEDDAAVDVSDASALISESLDSNLKGLRSVDCVGVRRVQAGLYSF